MSYFAVSHEAGCGWIDGKCAFKRLSVLDLQLAARSGAPVSG